MEFKEFTKIARLNRDITVTEKIDGTNASILIINKSLIISEELWINEIIVGDFIIRAGSRTRWIQPENDNHGFAKWVKTNAEELVKLGEGRHFGEWYGQGIQRNYGLTEKRFALFNTFKWSDDSVRPKCCGVVPVLYHGLFSQQVILDCLEDLRKNGSKVCPYMNPEGIVVYHEAAKTYFKITLVNDEKPKSQVEHENRR